MGNQLSGIAPAQILSVDNYFNDLPEFQYHASLGSTRFMKVARAKHKEGYVVVKVFVIHDPSLPLQYYMKQIMEISKTVQSIPNVLPFQRVLCTERAGVLIRQYVHDNLYDRISTRPFLSMIEKKWIVFQLLSVLDQCHNAKICHGDIKSENILITSWGWMLLSDIASFKPVQLPVDNPADFNYFFDTTRRRTCYIAPERFVDSSQLLLNLSSTTLTIGTNEQGPSLPSLNLPGADDCQLKPTMDIFSVGCVIAELFCDGSPLFDLSQLLSYRSGDYSPELKLVKIDNNVKAMVKQMIARNPADRLSAKEYIDRYSGHIFPEEFSTFLRGYLKRFASLPVLTADEKIAKLKADMHKIKTELLQVDDNQQSRDVMNHKENCFVIIASLVTSCVRSLKFCISKLTALDLMLEISHYVGDDVILERLLPYAFYLIDDTLPRVRAHTIQTITNCLSLVQNLPRNESNIFPEYILPNLSYLANDPEVIVQVAFAENIALLSETALRFLEMAQINNMRLTVKDENDGAMQYQGSYDSELNALHDLIQRKIVTLLTTSENIVKRTLVEKGLVQLCVFFGRQKANDVLLSHIITFLNDKNDWYLRGAFFDSIVGVAAYVGWQSLSILKPLMQQGLKDTEEFVVCKALKALICWAELGLLQKPILMEFLREALPFLYHPNSWIRYAAVGYISACSKALDVTDNHCMLMPQVKEYLKRPIIQLENQTIVLSFLKEPIPRPVFDYVIRSPLTAKLLARLEEIHFHGLNETDYGENDEQLSQGFRKLRSQGMTTEVEKKLIKLKDTICKLSDAKESTDRQYLDDPNSIGILDLSSLRDGGMPRKAALQRLADTKVETKSTKRVQTAKKKEDVKPLLTPSTEPRNVADKAAERQPSPAGASPVEKEATKQAEIEMVNPSDGKEITQPIVTKKNLKPSSIPLVDHTYTDQAKYAKCREELRTLLMRRRDQYLADTKQKFLIGAVIEGKGKQHGWKPKGQLVAHLQEHKSAVNRVVVSHDFNFFATASDDSTVKIWDAVRLDRKSSTTRSRFTYNRQGCKINGLTFAQGSHTVACCSDDSSINVVRIETASQGKGSKLIGVTEKHLNPKEEGCVVDLTHYDTGCQSILAFATVYGYICGWDLRMPDTSFAWRLKNNPKMGLITCLTVDPLLCWMTCGTSDGNICCWDMRFQLPITEINHHTGARIRRVASHPMEPSWIIASFQGNNEISMWDLETSARRQTLWASPHPPLSQSKVSADAAHAIHIADQDTKTYILAGGSDKRIREWDLRQPENSSVMAGASTDNLDGVVLKYKNRLIDGTEVIYETYERSRSHIHYDDAPKRGPDEPPPGHNDCISDITITRQPQNFVISGSRDGVVKVWK